MLMIAMPTVSRPNAQRARELREQMTDAEVRLWFRLRANRIGGHHFRRQVPVGPYVVDFLCVKAQLVVEVDGSQHQTALNHDEARTAWLRARGFRVLRFWNNEVLAQTESVLERIRLVLLEPPPCPPPQAGEGSFA